MSHIRTFIPVRAISGLACAAVLLLSACGGSDSTSNRNGRLNSVLCFDTQDLKDQAIADAEKALTEAQATPPLLEDTQPLLEDASSDGASSRVNLAFIGPRLWWMHFAVEETTTTTTTPTTSSIPSVDSSETTVPTTESTDVSTETSVPIVEDAPLQQLQDALDAATNAPLCSELDATESSDAALAESESVDCSVRVDLFVNEPANNKQAFLAHVQTCDAFTHWDITLLGQAGVGQPPVRFESKDAPINENLSGIGFSIYAGKTLIAQGEVAAGDVFETSGTTVDTTADTTEDTTVDTGSTITCTANVTSNGASFDCARPLSVSFFYRTYTGGNENPVWLFGNEATTFGPIDDVAFASVAIYNQGPALSNLTTGVYEFQVVDPAQQDEGEEGPQLVGHPALSGGYVPAALTSTFTISVLDGVPVYGALFAPCDTQTIDATIAIDDETTPFDEMEPFMLPVGLCGVSFWAENGLSAGDYMVSVNVSSLSEISWYAEVESISLSSDEDSWGPDSYGNQVSPSDVAYTLVTQQVDAPQTFTIEVPAGGLWFTARGNTNQARADYINADPFLILLDDQNSVIALDDDGGETDINGMASFIETWLDEGTYYLVATIYDIQHPEHARNNPPTQYELVYGLETSETITSPADVSEAVTPSADAPAIVLPSNEFELPVESIVVGGNSQINSGVPVIPIGVTSMLCTNDCILTLFENAGIDAVSIELNAGGESVVVTRSSHKVRVPVARGATSITAVAKSADGATVAEMSSQVHQMSVNDVAMMSNTKNTNIKPSASKPVDSQNNGLYVLAALVLISILAFVNSRRKGAVTKG